MKRQEIKQKIKECLQLFDGVDVCHDCLKFVNHRSKLEDNTPFIQLDIDTRYVASNAIQRDSAMCSGGYTEHFSLTNKHN